MALWSGSLRLPFRRRAQEELQDRIDLCGLVLWLKGIEIQDEMVTSMRTAMKLVTVAALLLPAQGFHPPAAHGTRMKAGCGCDVAACSRREAISSLAAFSLAAATAAGTPAPACATPAEAPPTLANMSPVPQAGQVPGLFQSARGYGKGNFEFLVSRATRWQLNCFFLCLFTRECVRALVIAPADDHCIAARCSTSTALDLATMPALDSAR